MTDESLNRAQALATGYAGSTLIRAAVQLIPYVGGALDTLLSGTGSAIQARRLDDFIQQLATRMHTIEVTADGPQSDEERFDLLLASMRSAAATRSAEKRERFANIVARAIGSGRPWEEAEAAQRLLANLEDIHVEILTTAGSAPICTGPFDLLQVVALLPLNNQAEDWVQPLQVREALSQYAGHAVTAACSELLSYGLLHDEGVGRWDTAAATFFTLTEQGRWFLSWVADARLR